MKAAKPPMDHNRSYLCFQRAGEQALQEERYEAAKCALDQALSQASQRPNNDPSSLIGILDLRVEVQLRLKDINAATRDACTMIRHDRADARGYLRCVQLDRLKKDLVGAQKWYEQGLKNVPQANVAYFESMISKTTGEGSSAQSKPQDPLIVLPMDLIHMVFVYFDLREVTTFLRVSKTWRNTLLATHSVWRTFDLLGTKKDVTLGNMRACIQRLRSPPTTVRLDKLTPSAAGYLQPYLIHWTRAIEHLRINNPLLLDTTCSLSEMTPLKSLHLGQRCPVSFEVVDELLHCCNMLEHARFDAVLKWLPPNATSPATPIDDDERAPPQAIMPALSHLALTACGKPTDEANWIHPVSLHSAEATIH